LQKLKNCLQGMELAVEEPALAELQEAELVGG
jgi:hypothetical protein